MASIPCVLIMLLICWTQDHMGVRGETPTVFSSVGQNATLPCGNVAQPDCSTTSWIHSDRKATVELVQLGKVEECTDPPNSDECKRAKRLSLHSGCSLHITEVTTDEAGLYTCQQYGGKDKPKIRNDTSVHLSVLSDFKPTSSSTSVSKSFTPKTTTDTPSNSGSSGVRGESPTVFSSVGQNATLPCGNVAQPDCSTTTWIHSDGKATVELVTLGKVKECTDRPNSDECKRAKRLSLHSGCSLHITEVTTDEAGLYTCQQYGGKGEPKIRNDTSVHLSVLSDFKPPSTSTSVSKSSTPKTTTDTPSNSGTSGAQPTFLPGTQVSDNKPTSLSTSVSKSSTPKTTNIPVSPDSGSSVTPVVPLIAGVGVPLGLLAAALIIVVMHKRRTNAGGETKHTSKEDEADLHYAAFQHLNPTQARPSAKQSEDTVTYSSIMQLSGGEDQNSSRPAGGPADSNAVYATVQKSDKTQD
ncbi:endochitinase A-like [Alosa sapidissima]|uniref:endochitinase A-like n=1 Tax=Alosa sapidissima TaxID=34773 RepID=UPI001C09D303|nr:endochitinase A-like [Alosa sapidissima]